MVSKIFFKKAQNTTFGLVGLYFTISPNVQKQDMVQKKQREKS